MSKRNTMAELEDKLKAAKEAHEEATTGLKAAKEASEPIRRERGFNIVESQQIRTQIDICRARIEELHLLIRAKEREAEEVEDRTKTEIQVYKQKVKHLMHNHRKDLTAVEGDKQQALEKSVQEHQNNMKNLENETQRLIGDYMMNQGHHAMQQKQQKEES